MLPQETIVIRDTNIEWHRRQCLIDLFATTPIAAVMLIT